LSEASKQPISILCSPNGHDREKGRAVESQSNTAKVTRASKNEKKIKKKEI